MALFGGFDDYFLTFDGLIGRTKRIETMGRTALYPWNDELFLVVEGALGRPSRTVLSLRAHGEPAEIVDRIVAADLPCEVTALWGDVARLVPGHFPTIFEIGGGTAATFEAPQVATDAVRADAIPGVFRSAVPVMIDGRLETYVARGQLASAPHVLASCAVGRDRSAWLAHQDGLTLVEVGAEAVTLQGPVGWAPQSIEHVPGAERILVASWKRWGSLGGPSTDIYVLEESGAVVGTAAVDGLARALALIEEEVFAVDVSGEIRAAHISAP